MDTAWLADLQALAETLNFSRAAERRNITQPAFGRRIKSLEEWCGSVLVDRSTHRLQLTTAGELMLEAANDIHRRLERARRDLDQSRASMSTLTFASTHALSFIFFPEWIQNLGAATSTMPIRLLSDNMKECEKMMLEGRAQFLLCHHRVGGRVQLDEREFKYVELATDQLIPVTGKDAGGRALYDLPGSPEAPVPNIAFDDTSGMGRILSASLSGRAGELHLSTVVTSHLAMVLKALAADGKGIAWIPRSLALDEIGPNGRLLVAGANEWAVDVKIVLFRQRARMADIAEKFWDLVHKKFA
ncbi:MAG: LysR family transcriptional regulator [Rhizobiaceae bacterium]|nr:LysR family transcriptional regulator [Rhizobiaceae bacterium]